MRGTTASPRGTVARMSAMNLCCLEGLPSLLAGVDPAAGIAVCLRSGLMLMHSLTAKKQHRHIRTPTAQICKYMQRAQACHET